MRLASKTLCLLLVLAFAAVCRPAWAALSQDNFQLRNTGDLVALCTAPQTDPLATAALNFCHGFAVGVTRAIERADAAAPVGQHMFCLPATVNRNQALADFVRWVSADPSRSAMPAADGVAAFLAAQYPCHR